MVTLVIAGEEAPEYNTPVYRHGREVGKLLSPSAGRSPTVDRLIGMACIETELTEVGTPLEVALTDGRTVPALVDRFPIYDPEKKRPRAWALMPDRPVGILAEDAHGISVATALQRLLPREDLLLLCDDAYAPYARRRPDVVVRRVAELLGQLRAEARRCSSSPRRRA